MIGPPEEEILILIDEVLSNDDKIEKLCFREFCGLFLVWEAVPF